VGTSVAGVHVGYDGDVGVQVGDHLGVLAHIVELGYAEVCMAESRGGGSCARLLRSALLSLMAIHCVKWDTMYRASKPVWRAIRAENPS